ncbi:hypothetical protein MMC13_000822 [Lambiella insularis]|nr:hypothetical protein [Lambiella insularis]
MSTYMITGSSRSLGLAIVSELATRPAEQVQLVIATARTKTPALQKILDTYSDTVVFIPLEVDKQSSINKAVRQVQSALGSESGLDVLINNAGVLDPAFDGISTMYANHLSQETSSS